MIAAPPADRALPGLPRALDGERMRELLAARLGVAVDGCEPCYVRYKPETNCIVQYRLALDGEETIAYAKLYAGGRAQRVWERGSLQRLAAAVDGGPNRVAQLPELGAVLQVHPVDVALPALAPASSEAGARELLDALDAPGPAGPAELVRYKPARKALLRWGTVYAKLYAHGRGGIILRAGRALQAAGVPTAPVLGYLPDARLLAHAEVPGRTLRGLRGTAAYEAGVRAAGETLARLHAVAPVVGAPRHGWVDEAAALTATVRTIGTLRPELAADAAALADRLVGALGELPQAWTTLHGDFYDDQVLVAGGDAVLLDFDGIRRGHPLVDVGNFLAHLSVRDAGDPARESFLGGYGAATAGVLEAAALLKLVVAPFRRLEPGWPQELERRLRLSERRLSEHRPPARGNGRRLDPALPQLAVLRDPALVGAALADVYGERVEVRAATVVRHKPGRRCTLRYDVLRGVARRPERLYGKTFASERGPRVHKGIAALAAARAGGTAALPEPVAYVGALKLLLQREVPGAPVRPALLAGDVGLATAIAEEAHALHSSGVALDRRHGWEDELAVLRSRVDRLRGDRSHVRTCLARIEAAAPAAWRLRPVHRDFYHDQLLVDRGRLSVLDLDDAAMSEPAVDVANFLAHLRLLAVEEPAGEQRVAAAAAAFRARCHELDEALDPALVRLLESATLLRLSCIHELHAARLVDEAEALLGVPTRPEPQVLDRAEKLA